MTDKKKYAKIDDMIAYEDFAQDFNSGDIKKLHFHYDSKEYLITREEGEEGPVFAFATEEQKPVKYPTAKALLKYAIIGGHSLREIWYRVAPICNNTLLDDDYVLTQYSDAFGQITRSASGTATMYDHYLMRRFIPTLAAWGVVFLVILMCTLFVPLSWTFFAVACSVSVGALAITLLIFFSNTRRYRHGNPSAHLYLLDHGAVLLTNRVEYAIPYTKILRLDTEAGIKIVTIKTVFTFVANDGGEITQTLKNTVETLKAERKNKKKAQKSSTS